MCRLLVFIVLNLYSVGLYAQRDNKFFRNDYTYLEQTESFYKIHTIPKTWNDAKAACELEGATFFYPEDEVEADAVIDYWNKTQHFAWVYIGVSSQLVKGVFETVDGIPIVDVYSKWSIDQPNDLGGKQDCVVWYRLGPLNDDLCDKKFPFICKKKLSSLEWNSNCNIPVTDYVYNETFGKCYKIHKNPKSWNNAHATCNAEQSYLAVIDSPAEAEYLKDLVERSSQQAGEYLRGAVLVGIHNELGDGWKTVKGVRLEDSGYSKWDLQQPDGGDGEKCGAMFYNTLLNDVNCDTKALFVCEHDIHFLLKIFARHGV